MQRTRTCKGCGSDVISEGAGRPREWCSTCRPVKRQLRKVPNHRTIAEELLVTTRKWKHNKLRVRHLKGRVKVLEVRLEENRGMRKALTKSTKDRDKMLARFEEQGKVVSNYKVVVHGLKAKVDGLQQELEAEQTAQVLEPIALRTAVEIASVPCPECRKAAVVVWRRTKSFDLLEGKCAHCGHHMNAIRPHGLKGDE